MRLHKLKASDTTGTYLVESPVTETDIMLMARQLASLRLRKGRALTSPKEVFSHLGQEDCVSLAERGYL